MAPHRDEGSTSAGGVLSLAWRAKLVLMRFVMVATSAAFTVLVFAQVVMRYLLGVSVFAIEELAIYCAFWLYFLGAAHGAHERAHISASLMDVLLPSGRARAAVSALASLISAVLAAWMTRWSAEYFLWSLDRGGRSVELDIPTAWIHGAMPVGLGLMALYFIVAFVDDARAFWQGRFVEREHLEAP